MGGILRGRTPVAGKYWERERPRGEGGPAAPALGVASKAPSGAPAEWREAEAMRRRFGEIQSSDPASKISIHRFSNGIRQQSAGIRNGFHSAVDLLRRIFEAWTGGPHGAPLLMGLGFLLGQGRRALGPGGWRGDVLHLRESSAPVELGLQQAELFRSGEHLQLKALVGGVSVHLWSHGRWRTLPPGASEKLNSGDIFALGLPPAPEAICEAYRRPEGIQALVYRVQRGPEPDTVRVTEIRPPSLQFFLFESFFYGDGPVFERRDRGAAPHLPERSFGETMRLALSFGLSKAAAQIRIAERLSGQGHFEAADREFEAAQGELRQLWKKASGMRPSYSPADPRVPITRKEAGVLRVLGEWAFAKALHFEWSQRPEAAAEAYAQAADAFFPLVRQSIRHELASYNAYKLYLRTAEANLVLQRYAAAADAFEQAARFATVARVYSRRSMPLPRLRPQDPIRLLEQAVLCLLRAGPHFHEPMRRLQRKLEELREEGGRVFR